MGNPAAEPAESSHSRLAVQSDGVAGWLRWRQYPALHKIPAGGVLATDPGAGPRQFEELRSDETQAFSATNRALAVEAVNPVGISRLSCRHRGVSY